MPVFQYKGIDKERKSSQGIVEAGSLAEAKNKLRQQGLMVTFLKQKKAGFGSLALKGENLVTFTLQLSQLINAGLPLYESLVVLEEQYRGEKAHALIMGLADKVKSGTALSAAMADYPNSFDTLYQSMVAAGEASGSLDFALESLTELLEKQMKLKKQLMTALIYPSILAGVCTLLIHMLLSFVVPQMSGIFAGRELNGYTQFVLNVSQLYQGYAWLLFLGVAGLIGGLYYYSRKPAGRTFIEQLMLRLPLVRTLLIRGSLARFARTMTTLQTGGVSLIDSLRLAKGVMGVQQLQSAVERAELRIVEGQSLSQELKQSTLIPVMVPRMIAVGEETGSLGVMWSKIADIYEGDVEKLVGRVLAMLQPVILVIMGALILFIMLAILMPLTDVGSLGI